MKLTSSITFEDFKSNTAYQDAVARNIKIIDEAAKNLSTSFDDDSGISIPEMVERRNFLIQQYFRIDARVV